MPTREGIRTAIHAIKKAWGLPADAKTWFSLNGDMFHPMTGEFIGNILVP